MNKERLLKLADIIENDYYSFNGVKAAFDMSDWFKELEQVSLQSERLEDILGKYPECNTCACIAGFAVHLWPNENPLEFPYFKGSAREILELTNYQASLLFEPGDFSDYWEKITGKHAAAVIREFVETEEIDWLKYKHLSPELD